MFVDMSSRPRFSWPSLSTLTLFLRGPDEYEGGELVVEDTYGTHAVKLPAGELILYPATSLHRVNPVTRGDGGTRGARQSRRHELLPQPPAPVADVRR